LVYDELIGPNLYFLLNDDGPESYQFPAKMIRKIARQSLIGLALIHEQNTACRMKRLLIYFISISNSFQEYIGPLQL
jgi:hypothetical protein